MTESPIQILSASSGSIQVGFATLNGDDTGQIKASDSASHAENIQ
jgi:hypothetical protein